MIRVSPFPAISGSERCGAFWLAPLAFVVLGLMHADSGLAQEALPQGGSVAHGNVTITTPAPGQMVLEQSSDRAVLNWGSFSIGTGNSVDIHQPGSNSAILNRVTGNTTSQIHGQLNANGQVFVVNPNGVFIGPQGQVTAGGGFVASTLDTKDRDFMAGRLRFEGQGASAAVVNEGRILIGRGGFAALLGGRVSNSGLVMVPMGQIGFGAGERATLDVSGDGFLEIEVPSDMQDEMRALIDNSGTASAEGGLIEMKAATARHAARHAINLSGVAEASSVSVRNGTIVLGGGAGGRVTVSGRVSTRAKRPSHPAIVVENSSRPKARRGGGDITILGRQIELTGAQVDASGAGQAGNIHIGGAYQGGDSLPRALYLDVDSASSIRADGVQVGDGGRVILWSDVHTDFAGNISARGGAGGGDGGFVEVSGKQTLAFNGLVDTRGPLGATGTLLLDPYNVFIENVGANERGGFTGNDFVPTDDDSVLSVSLLEANLAANNINVTTGTGGAQAGNITVNSQIDWASTSILTFEAFGDVILNAGVVAPLGTFVIEAGGAITTSAAGVVNVGAFGLESGHWSQISATLPGFQANNFTIVSDAGTSFVRATAGDGTGAAPYVLADIYGVQGIGSLPLLDDNFALGNDVDATVTETWNGGAGFEPILGILPSGARVGFSGTLDGRGNTISDLTIRGTSGGFFALTEGASISNLNLTDLDAFGSSWLGGLVNRAIETQIDNVNLSGTVVGDQVSDIGGIVGRLEGATSAVSNSSFTGSIEAGIFIEQETNVGGLIGSNDLGTLSNSTFSGDITDAGTLGGFVHRLGGAIGDNQGAITGVTTEGTITPGASIGPMYAGGIAGESLSAEGITQSSSSVVLDINNTESDTIFAGGLVGFNAGRVTGSQSTGNVNVTSQGGELSIGGLIGYNENTADRPVNDVSASGVVTVSSTNLELVEDLANVGGLIGINQGPISNVRATGNVNVSTLLQAGFVGGLVGANTSGGDMTAAFATGDVAFTTDLEGAIGGLIGVNGGSISDSYALGNVLLNMPTFGVPAGSSAAYSSSVGGFVGANEGSIVRSAARGAVNSTVTTIDSSVGGFIGENDEATILNSYALGSVTSTSDALHSVGGFVGITGGASITNAVSSGAVAASGSGTAEIGGLIGHNFEESTIVTASYWDTLASGQADTMVAALGRGLTTAQFEDTSGFIALAAIEGWDFDTVWAPGTAGRYPTLYTIDRVVFAQPNDLTLTYGGTTGASTTGSVAGGPGLYVFANAGETLDTSPIFNSLHFPDVNAGTRDFTVGTSPLNSSAGQSYDVVALSGHATITPAPLTITADGQVKFEGDVFIFGGTEFSTQGLVFSDTVSQLNLSSTGAEADAPIGQYSIEASNASGTGLSNYNITYEFGVLEVQEPDGNQEPGGNQEPDGNPDIFPSQPTPSFTLPNPNDTVVLTLSEILVGADGSIGASAGNSSAVSSARETLNTVQELANSLDVSTAGCAESSGSVDRYLACLSDAVDDFAAELDEISTDLPPGMENVAGIVRDASRSVTQARNRARSRLASATTDAQRQQIRREAVGEAQAALSTASAEIRKSISLVRADDPELAAVQRSTITTVAAAVESAGIGLSKVTEL